MLDHGQFILGPEVTEMETRLEAYTGASHCISVGSGTDALLIALMALGVGPGDEVITTPFTFVATAEMIVLLGATPVFVDVEPDTCNIDAELIEAAITPRTKAIMPVSLYGQTADMDEINAIAAKHGIVVIEDAAQSFGADYRSRKSCNVSPSAAPASSPASRSAATATAARSSSQMTSSRHHARAARARAGESLLSHAHRHLARGWTRCNAR